ncbi:hypothetical protein O181_072078 [Austropuccinia psidii MF-1]|uniref:Uncharacterized protein n=1 Tax=Austropuccinia psidii MF-1 TaxID=1389203 RepID=A0A9Q3F6R2_9BASI|nr:hypothetical protein [Austropuccinia psidii MF-1]
MNWSLPNYLLSLQESSPSNLNDSEIVEPLKFEPSSSKNEMEKAEDQSNPYSLAANDSHSTPSPINNDHSQQLMRRKPKDTFCIHCHHHFTARGAKLHAQRCSRKRENDLALIVQDRIRSTEAQAKEEREIYDAVIKQMREEIYDLQESLKAIWHTLEITKRDYQTSLEYVDTQKIELELARSEINRLQQNLEFSINHPSLATQKTELTTSLLL